MSLSFDVAGLVVRSPVLSPAILKCALLRTEVPLLGME